MTLETGEVARQSAGAVIVTIDDTVVLATVVAAKSAKPGQDFFPLTVDYIEKTYAAGKIPGSFFKREGRPSELETLTSRLIDRPLRPLFPDGFFNEVQVVIHVLSLNPEVQADIAALIGAQRRAGDLRHPVQRPDRRRARRLRQRRVRAEPGQDRSSRSPSSTWSSPAPKPAVLMVESEADQLSEEVMLGAVVFGHEQGKIAIDAIHELVRDAGKPAWDWQPPGQGRSASSPRSPRWPRQRCAPPTRSAASRSRTQACREAYADVMAR